MPESSLSAFIEEHPKDLFLFAVPALTATLNPYIQKAGNVPGTRFIFLAGGAKEDTVSHEIWHVLTDYGRELSSSWDLWRDLHFDWQWHMGPSEAFKERLRKGVDHWSPQ